MIIICDKCEGQGEVEYNVGTHNSDYERELCGKCKGSGRMIKKTTIAYKPFISEEADPTRLY